MIEFKDDIYNAKIKSSFLGSGEDGKFYIQIVFDYGSNRVASTPRLDLNTQIVQNILVVLGVPSWEELPRKFARIKITDKKVVSFGNIIEDRWLKIAE